MPLIYAKRRSPVAAPPSAHAYLAASATHLLVKLVLAAPASFFSAALASQAAMASPPASASHFFMKLVLAAPASFLSAALAAQPPMAMGALAAMPGASLWELAKAEVETARARAAVRVSRCRMNYLLDEGEAAGSAATGRIGPRSRARAQARPSNADGPGAALEDAARMRQRFVRRVQAPHEHLDEGVVEQVARARAQLQQGLGRERDRRRRLGDDDVGAVALELGARREVGHLADRSSRAELGDLLAVAEDLDLALRDDVKAVAFLALAIERVAEVEALPLGAVDDFPQLDIAEVGEEFERAQEREAFRIENALELAARHLLGRDQRRDRLCELAPVGVAIAGLLGERLLDDIVERGRDAAAHAGQRGRLGVVDLMHHRRLHLRIEERAAGDQVIEDGAER